MASEGKSASHTAAIGVSTSPRGAPAEVGGCFSRSRGAGSAARSSFPEESRGKASTGSIRAGTMKAGRRLRRCERRRPSSMGPLLETT